MTIKCTTCSTPVHPIVAVDIDGTLAQYHRHFFEFASKYFDTEFSRDYDGRSRMHEHMGIPLEDYRRCKLAYRQGGMKRSIPMYPGAESFMWSLRDMDVEVWITTTRPYARLDGTDPDTRFWLENHGIMYDYLLYDEDKYKILRRNVTKSRVIAVVDDLEEQCEAAGTLFGTDVPLMPDRQHNRYVGYWTKFKDFHELTTIIKERVGNWHARRT